MIRDDASKLDLLEHRLARAIPNALENQMRDVVSEGGRLDRAMLALLASNAAAIERLQKELKWIGPSIAADQQRQVALAAAQLDALSPLKTLSRGYAIAYEGDGSGIVKSVEGKSAGDRIVVRVGDGRMNCTVDGVEKN